MQKETESVEVNVTKGRVKYRPAVIYSAGIPTLG